MKFLKSQIMCLVALGLGSMAGAALAADVSLYTYHSEPPFVTGEGKGLSYDMAEYLGKKTGNKYQVKLMPRGRVNEAVQAADFKDAVIWVFPPWFKDKDKTTYLWSDALFADENIIVSTLAKKVDYTSPDSLKGMSFGGVLGHNYVGIDDLVATKAIERSDVPNEEANLKKVAAGRVDATLLPRSSATYLFSELSLDGKVYVSKNPQSSYTRHILVSKKNPELQKQLNTAIADMKKDSAWQEVLKKYKVKAN